MAPGGEAGQHRPPRSRRCRRRRSPRGRSGRRPRRRSRRARRGRPRATRTGGQMTRMTSRHVGRGGDRRGQGAGLAGQAVHLPVAGDDDGAHGPIIRARRRGGGGCARAARSARWTRTATHAPARSASSREGGLRAPRSGAPRPTRGRAAGSAGQAAVGLERLDGRELACDAAAPRGQVGRLGVEHPVEVAVQLARHQPRLQLQDARRRAHPAQEGERPPSMLFQVTTPRPAAHAPRGGQRRCPRAVPPSSGASSAGTTSSRCVPPAGQAQRAARQEPAAQPGHAAVVGAPRPSRRPARRRRPPGGPPAAPRPASARGPSAASPRPARVAGRQQARAGSMAASSARSASTRSRSDRRDGVPTPRRSGRGRRARVRRRAYALRAGHDGRRLGRSSSSRTQRHGQLLRIVAVRVRRGPRRRPSPAAAASRPARHVDAHRRGRVVGRLPRA